MEQILSFLWTIVCLLSLALLLLRIKTVSRGGKRVFLYRRKPIMTASEAAFFQRLQRANTKGYVFPQVSFLALLQPVARSKRNWWRSFGHISQKRVDYALYNDKLELLCIVELDDLTHDAKKDSERDAAFASAGIKTLRWQVDSKPDENEIRTQLEQLKTA